MARLRNRRLDAPPFHPHQVQAPPSSGNAPDYGLAEFIKAVRIRQANATAQRAHDRRPEAEHVGPGSITHILHWAPFGHSARTPTETLPCGLSGTRPDRQGPMDHQQPLSRLGSQNYTTQKQKNALSKKLDWPACFTSDRTSPQSTPDRKGRAYSYTTRSAIAGTSAFCGGIGCLSHCNAKS